jgi:hypothetical protein
LGKPLSNSDKLGKSFNQVEGQVDEAAMFCDCPHNVLPNPPNGIGAEPSSTLPIKLVNGSYESQATFLH